MVFESRTPCAADRSGFAAKTRRATARYPQSTTIHRTSLWYSNPARPCAAVRSGFAANPQGLRPVSTKQCHAIRVRHLLTWLVGILVKPVLLDFRFSKRLGQSHLAHKPGAAPSGPHQLDRHRIQKCQSFRCDAWAKEILFSRDQAL